MIIGPSTGWLYAEKVYALNKQETILMGAGASALEIPFLPDWHGEENKKRMLSLRSGKKFDPQIFTHRSVHLPVISGQETEPEFAMTKEIISFCNASIALTHPLKTETGDYPIKTYEKMIAKGIPLAIENVDKNKDGGFDPKELERLTEILGRFVLDTQHAFEHDSTMEYAFDLFDAMKDKIVYLHVSGETEGNLHTLVHLSRNCDTIISFLGAIFSEIRVPIILEGKYTNSDELRKEIEFLTRELC